MVYVWNNIDLEMEMEIKNVLLNKSNLWYAHALGA